MAKSRQRLQAIALRKQGKSIKNIARILGAAQSSVSVWCRDISLSKEQRDALVRNGADGLKLGQLIAAELKRKKRMDVVADFQKQGLAYFNKLTQKEFFTFGLALYLCEGAKTDRRFVFTNSDPALIRVLVKWLHAFYGIDNNRLGFRVQIHEMHKPREKLIQNFWRKYLNLSSPVIITVNYIKTARQKVYENYDSYYGTMHLRVLKGTHFFYRIQGLIDGIISKLNQA